MRHKVDGRKFGRDTGQRKALFRKLVTDLLDYGKVDTTLAKAKEVRPIAERIITMGKNGTLASRRRALAYIYDDKVVDKLFSDLAKQYAQRPGGYTRITKMGMRLGDGAPMARIELVQ
ncbi:MAG: 50S ribosomal protein L17 [Dehalococcoidaceae bacterium]|nr:50S ribosomal protein L17 [Dehalococcoidaceae bacterium]